MITITDAEYEALKVEANLLRSLIYDFTPAYGDWAPPLVLDTLNDMLDETNELIKEAEATR